MTSLGSKTFMTNWGLSAIEDLDFWQKKKREKNYLDNGNTKIKQAESEMKVITAALLE